MKTRLEWARWVVIAVAYIGVPASIYAQNRLIDLYARAMPAPPPPPPIFQQAQQGPQVLPSHRHGPHEGEEGAICYRGETRSISRGRKLYHCECKWICDQGAGGELLQREDDDCETSCAPPDKPQCSCHTEEVCQQSDAPGPKDKP